jgi:hypothetical protein
MLHSPGRRLVRGEVDALKSASTSGLRPVNLSACARLLAALISLLFVLSGQVIVATAATTSPGFASTTSDAVASATTTSEAVAFWTYDRPASLALTTRHRVASSGLAAVGALGQHPNRTPAIGRDRAVAAEAGGTVLPGLSPAEQASLSRLEQLPEFASRTFSESPSVGQDWVDNLGNTYDQMGDPAASAYWGSQEQNFLNQSPAHLAKADYVVLDMNGFTESQIGAVAQYVDSLAAAEQARLIRLGF